MIAYKGFTKDLTATLGRGTFRYEVGKTYENEAAQCVSTGFHCVEEPINVLSWYSAKGSRYCIVEAGGDIHEDGNERIACTNITILREISRLQLAVLECQWLSEHPNREYSRHIQKDQGMAGDQNGFVIVRGKKPRAAGPIGSHLFLVREGKRGKEIEEIGVYKVDGKEYLPNTYYDASGKAVSN